MQNAPYLEGIRENSRSTAINTGGYIFLSGCGFAAAIWFLAAVGVTLLPAVDPLILGAVVFFLFGVAAFAVGLYFLFNGAGQAKRVVAAWILALEKEIEHRFPTQDLPEDDTPTPLALPATPSAPDTFRYTHNGVGEDVPKKTIRGLDPRDLEWLCQYLANGGKWTEERMEALPLTYTGGKLGKATEGTPYTRFMQLCIEAGIIVGREGKRSGTLAILSAPEMMQAIRNLPEGA